MPTYDYRCDACGHAFEEFQQISKNPLRTCPKCHKRKLRRLIGAGAAVIFKGSGFYQTDYRSKEYSEKAKAEKKGDGKSTTGDAKKDASSSDTKKDSSSSKKE